MQDLLKYNMPDELMQFIQRDTYSLLIKGFAGTGKTTLALTILRALESKTNFFYISTRISPKQLFQYYPWLARFIEQPKPANPSETSDHVAMPAFEDARLDEPESLFERITNQLMDIKSPIIIIDSWDAIASFMDKEARLNNERVLQTWRERAGAKLIFISEHPEDTTLDFLVDGIVELKQNNYENAKVREIFMLKLRGVRISRPSYFYTLESSVFRSFAPYRPAKLEPPRKEPAGNFELLAPSGHVRTGYPALDSSLGGGFPRKGVVLLELDSHIGTAVALAFLGRMVSNFVSAGNPVLFQPFDWIDPKMVMGYLDPCVSKKDLFKILWPAKVSGMTNVVSLDKKQPGAALASMIKPKQKGKLMLNIMGTDVMQKTYGKDLKSAMEQVLPALRASDSLTIAVLGQTQKETSGYFAEVADIHLKLQMINGTLFLQSLVPASTLYSVVLDGHFELEPVV